MPDQKPIIDGAICPLPLSHHEQIVMGHGSGGRMTRELIEAVFSRHFSNSILDRNNDAASLELDAVTMPGSRVAVSTDCHVISPLFFPGGDIGRLSVCGTVNDVAMLGAEPRFLTAGFILEEGLLISRLEEIVTSMASAAGEAGVLIVAGDTKVVEKGKADGVFITTSGVGFIPPGRDINGSSAQPGDQILISGTIGDHGIAVLSARGDLGIDSTIQSDMAPLNHMIANMLEAAPHTHVLRDPTRGGVATTLNEIAIQSQVCMLLDEKSLPIRHDVNAACELLGFDPLYVANEGKVIVIVTAAEANQALIALQSHPYGENAAIIGKVEESPVAKVLLNTVIGATRILDMLSGSMLPRIC
ncbi:MAG: hydrogenase expression/formation protein HypE [Anaerolineaceae bacterium]|nr:hydrogenase expression/formation protein HypE [Anaerolineaceae bacterium]